MELTAESTSRFIQAGAVRLHYHEAGEGEPLLLIHGGAPGAFGWGNFGQNMEAFSRRFRTMIVDLPGYGLSDKPQIEGGRYAFYSRTFIAMLDALGIDRCHVVGLATGGAAAMMMALQAPERIDRLVLVNNAGGLPIFQPQPTEGMKVIMGYYGGDGPSRAKMRHYLETIIHDKSSITDEILEERYQASIAPEFMEQAPEGHGERPVVIEPIWAELHKIKARTLIVWGRENRVLGHENALFMLSRIRDAQLHIYGEAGLWVPWEKQAEFERLTVDFLQG